MTISLTQAILLGLFCGIAKCCIPYTAGAFMYNTVIFNAVIVGAVLGDMPHAMMIGASLQLFRRYRCWWKPAYRPMSCGLRCNTSCNGIRT